jgi:hypothetical protein
MFVIPEELGTKAGMLDTIFAGVIPTPLNDAQDVEPLPTFSTLESVAHPGSPDAKTVLADKNSSSVALLNCILGYFALI